MTALASPGGTVACRRLIPHKNELASFDDSSGNNILRRYNSATGAWAGNASEVTPVDISLTSIAASQSTDLLQTTVAGNSNIVVHAWLDQSKQFWFRVDSATDGSIIRIAAQPSGATAFDYLCAATVGNYAVLGYASAASQIIKAITVNLTTGVASGETTLASGASVHATKPVIDICAVSSTQLIATWQSNVPNTQVILLDVPALTTAAGPTTMSTEAIDVCLTVQATAGEFGAILYHSTAAGGMRAACFNPATTAQTVAPFSIEAVTVPLAKNCTLVRQGPTSMLAIWDRAVSAPSKGYILWRTLDSSGVVGTIQPRMANASLVSKGFAYNGATYANVGYFSAAAILQNTFFLMRFFPTQRSTTPYAMLAYRTAGTYQAVGHLSDIVNPSTGVFRWNGNQAIKLLNTSAPRTTITSFVEDFTKGTVCLPVEVGGVTMLTGGVVAKYDGSLVVEQNFCLYPEILSAVQQAAGSIADGTYSYIAIYESADANGNVDRSTTSVPVSITVAAGGGTASVNVTVEQLNIGRANSGWQSGTISLFRTTNAGTIYYYAGSVSLGSGSASSVISDTVSDATLIGRRQLYTNGGVLDREPPPASRHLVLHLGRVWGISAEDPKIVFYSGDYVPGEQIWFAVNGGGQALRIEPGGDCTALASLDDKLIIFKKDRLFKINGRGQNQLGQANDLSLPTLISSDCGCIDPRSVVSTPDGIMFQSNKGIYILTRSEQVVYIGAAVDYFTSNYTTCTSAVMVPDRREVRFTFQDPVAPLVTPVGVTLVYNYRDNAWTSWVLVSGTPAISSVFVGGVWYWGKADGTIYKEDPTTFLDAGSTYVPLSLETGWIQPAGQQGLSRVQWCGLLAELKSDCGIELQIAKDYVNAYVMDWTFGRTTLNQLPRAQVFAHLSQQQGEAFRVRVDDYSDGGTPGEGYAASGLVLTALAKRGSFEKFQQATAKG